jgi:pyruvate,water dikinase
MDTVKFFSEIKKEDITKIGSKAYTITYLYNNKLPIPNGFVIYPDAFIDDELTEDACDMILESLEKLMKLSKVERFAVRSSALNEDSQYNSFAGEYETLLNVGYGDELLFAVTKVYRSKDSDITHVYNRLNRLKEISQMSVIVMPMVNAQFAGVLYTSDAMSGSHRHMIGNYVNGLGDRLVSGVEDAQVFKISVPWGRYSGPSEIRPYSEKLRKYARKLISHFGPALDIEWTISDKKVYLLQVRPIASLKTEKLDGYEVNHSLDGDYLWTAKDNGERIMDVSTPISWSYRNKIDRELPDPPGYRTLSGNIGGRIYQNVSIPISTWVTYGFSGAFASHLSEPLVGWLPTEDIPIYPFEIPKLTLQLIMMNFRRAMLTSKFYFILPGYLTKIPSFVEEFKVKISEANDPEALFKLWENEGLRAFIMEGSAMSRYSKGRSTKTFDSIFNELTDLVGKVDAVLLLSDLRASGELGALAPLTGLNDLLEGEMTEDDYQKKFGHRSSHEFEIADPDPSENTDWLEGQYQDFNDHDLRTIADHSKALYDGAIERLQMKDQKQVKRLLKRLKGAAKGNQRREKIQNEYVRIYRLGRSFILKAAKLLRIAEEDISMLYFDEILDMLNGKPCDSLKNVDIRRRSYESYKKLPSLPLVIRGPFDPEKWTRDPDRRLDYYNVYETRKLIAQDRLVHGQASSQGRVEGFVRVLESPEEAYLLKNGEILVSPNTNVGWTSVLPKVKAFVTNNGDLFSCTSILARALGIPHVVGCSSATRLLRTGDCVIVDGSTGTVEILSKIIYEEADQVRQGEYNEALSRTLN